MHKVSRLKTRGVVLSLALIIGLSSVIPLRGADGQEVEHEELAKRPEKYYGKTVTVEGRVLRLFGKQSFTIESGARDNAPDVLVLVPKAPQGIGLSQVVTVTGAVREFNPEELSRTFQWFDSNLADFKLLADLRESPVVIADKIVAADGTLIWQAAAPVNSPQKKRSGPPRADKSREVGDQGIASSIEQALQSIRGVNAKSVNVKVEDGTVTFTGTVASLRAKDRLIGIAEKTSGVRDVQDRLDVRPAPPRSDAEIRRDIVAVLADDPVADVYKLDISVKQGVVQLNGSVESMQEKELVGQLAKGVKGVQKIENAIDIRQQDSGDDAAILAQIKDRFRGDPYLESERIEVSVRNGNVNLSGTISSLFQYRRALSNSWVRGVKTVASKDLTISPERRANMEDGKTTATSVTEPAGAVPKIKKPRSDERVQLDRSADQEIAHVLRTSFFHDARIPEPLPDIDVNGGVVALSGTVSHVRASAAAEELARVTPGVRSVRNEIKVSPRDRSSDRTIEQKLRAAFERDVDFDLQEMTVNVTNGTAVVSGFVDSSYEMKRAMEIAGATKGVQKVENRLVVFPLYAPPTSDVGSVDRHRDFELEQRITEQMFWSPFVNASQVDIKVKDGVATLTGKVDSGAEREAAEENAYEGGAVRVNNRLQIADSTVELDR